MLELTISGREFYDDSIGEFITFPDQKLSLEHSLAAISKWESKWKKPFFTADEKTYDQWIDYVQCMTLTQDVDPLVYKGLTRSQFNSIQKYMDDSMTATWIKDDPSKPRSHRVITSECIYSWMCSLGIPFECDKWHINRLFTLIRVCDIDNTPSKKMGGKELAANNRALNKARKARMGTRG